MYDQQAKMMASPVDPRNQLVGRDTPTQETEIAYSGKILDGELNNLHIVISALYDRLSPVMTEAPPANLKACNPERNVTSLLARGLVEGSHRVAAASERINEMLNRLAV